MLQFRISDLLAAAIVFAVLSAVFKHAGLSLFAAGVLSLVAVASLAAAVGLVVAIVRSIDHDDE